MRYTNDDILYCSGDDVYYEFGRDFGASYTVSVENTAKGNSGSSENQINTKREERNKQAHSKESHQKSSSTDKEISSQNIVRQKLEADSKDIESTEHDSLEIKSFTRIEVNDTAFLELNFNRKTIPGLQYIVAFYSESPYREYNAASFGGNNNDVVRIRLYNNEEGITYVCFPVLDESLKEDVEFKDLSHGWLNVKNKAGEPMVVSLKGKNRSVAYYSLNNSFSIKGQKSDIVSFETYRIPSKPLNFIEKISRYESKHPILYFLTFLSLVISISMIGISWVEYKEFKNFKDGIIIFCLGLGLLIFSIVLVWLTYD